MQKRSVKTSTTNDNRLRIKPMRSPNDVRYDMEYSLCAQKAYLSAPSLRYASIKQGCGPYACPSVCWYVCPTCYCSMSARYDSLYSSVVRSIKQLNNWTAIFVVGKDNMQYHANCIGLPACKSAKYIGNGFKRNNLPLVASSVPAILRLTRPKQAQIFQITATHSY